MTELQAKQMLAILNDISQHLTHIAGGVTVLVMLLAAGLLSAAISKMTAE